MCPESAFQGREAIAHNAIDNTASNWFKKSNNKPEFSMCYSDSHTDSAHVLVQLLGGSGFYTQAQEESIKQAMQQKGSSVPVMLPG